MADGLQEKLNSEKKCGLVSVIGAPNAGKSTLVNALVGEKISIVTPKAQTTRNIIYGICTQGNGQVILMDTPGIFARKPGIDPAMLKHAWRGANSGDINCLLIDAAAGLNEQNIQILENIDKRELPSIVVINKIDLISKEKLSDLTIEIKRYKMITQIFHISALNGKNVQEFKNYLLEHIPQKEWMYKEDEITTAPTKFLLEELVREKLLLKLNKEVPYSLEIDTEFWETMKDGSIKAHLVIYVTKESHKAIIVGKKGSLIKLVGTEARLEFKELIDKNVHLFLFVKVRSAKHSKFYEEY